jgi:antitoxin (DNA-binding transcriptional repressor) of toxin-antitoxin stability system
MASTRVKSLANEFCDLYNVMYNQAVKVINISEFRQQCLSLVDDLPTEGIVISRHGDPIAKLVPIRRSCAELIGSVPNLSTDPKDDLFSAGVKWDAES